MNELSFYESLREKMDTYVHIVYHLSTAFPREEIYCITSQLRRSSMSVVLNYIEGYARQRSKVHKNFLEISYGSLKESEYLLKFVWREKFFSNEKIYNEVVTLADEIGGMLWSPINKFEM